MPEISTENNTTAFSVSNGDVKPWEDVSLALQHGAQARAENDLPRAFAFYERVTELDPDRVEGWLGRAATAPTIDDAISSWARATIIAPNNLEATTGLQQRIAEWIAFSAPQDAAKLFDVGRILVEAGQIDLARQLLKRSTELDDRNEDAWIWRASVAQDSSESLSCLNQARRLNAASKDAPSEVNWSPAQVPDSATPANADQIAEAARLVELGQGLTQRQDRQGAHRLFQQATELDRGNEQAWLWRGSTTTDIDEALVCMESALLINPQNESAREARSWLRVKKVRERVASAPSHTALAQAAGPSDPPARRSVASILFLIVAPILVIVIGLAVLIWKLL